MHTNVYQIFLYNLFGALCALFDQVHYSDYLITKFSRLKHAKCSLQIKQMNNSYD